MNGQVELDEYLQVGNISNRLTQHETMPNNQIVAKHTNSRQMVKSICTNIQTHTQDTIHKQNQTTDKYLSQF